MEKRKIAFSALFFCFVPSFNCDKSKKHYEFEKKY